MGTLNSTSFDNLLTNILLEGDASFLLNLTVQAQSRFFSQTAVVTLRFYLLYPWPQSPILLPEHLTAVCLQNAKSTKRPV